MNSLDIVRAFIGEELTTAWADRLADAPLEQIQGLYQKLLPLYYDWLEHETEAPPGKAEVIYHCIDPLAREFPSDQQLDRTKQCLLYFPRLAIHDPLANAAFPIATLAIAMGGLPVTEDNEAVLRSDIRAALKALVRLADFVDRSDVILVPGPFAVDYDSVQRKARDELARLASTASLESFRQFVRDHHAIRTFGDPAEKVLGGVAAWGHVCAMVDYMPVAPNSLVRKALDLQYGHTESLREVAEAQHRAAQTLMEYRVPGISEATFEDVLRLRRDNEAFGEWRIAFGQVLDLVQREQPGSQAKFEVEVRQAAESILQPRAEDLRVKVKGSSALERIFLPSSLSVGAAGIALWISGSVPVATLVGGALTPAAWLLERAVKRWNRSGRKATLVREFYGYLLDDREK